MKKEVGDKLFGESSLKHLFDVESNPKILDFKVDGIPLWLLIRTTFLWDLEKEILRLSEPHVKIDPFALRLKDKIKYIYLTLLRMPYWAGKHDILIVSSSVDAMRFNEKRYYFNRLYFKMFDVYPSTLLLERSFKFSFRYPKMEKTLFLDAIDLIPALFRRFVRLQRKELDVVDRFIDYLHRVWLDFRWVDMSMVVRSKFEMMISNGYREMIVKLLRGFKIKYYLYSLLLDKIKPVLLIVEDAHYGGDLPLLILSKKRGIVTAEYQHGYIGQDHRAYNFHPNISSKVKMYLPDYFLTWGKYWSDSVNTPATKVEIGNFLLDEVKGKVARRERKKNLVLISGGTLPQEYVKIGRELKRKFMEYNLILRPHPSERTVAHFRYKDLVSEGYTIDNSNLYFDLLPQADIVVSVEKSTVLFEALLFTKHVFLYDVVNRFYKKDLPFHVVSSANDIKSLLRVRDRSQKNIWARNPTERFRDFLEEIGLCNSK